MTCEIKQCVKRDKEHYNVYINGAFYCTADKLSEAIKEIEEYEKGSGKNEN